MNMDKKKVSKKQVKKIIKKEVFIEKPKKEKFIIVALPRYSKVLKILKNKQYGEGLVKEYGSIFLEDGQIIRNNKSYKVKETEELKKLIKDGALISGGSGRRVANG